MPRLGPIVRLLVLLTPLICLDPPSPRAEDAPLMRLVERPQEQALVVNLTLNRISIDENFIIYQEKNRLLVPLSGVMSALEVAIAADPETGTASGFFIREDRRFALDLAAGTASFDGRTFTLQPGTVERQLTDIYVDTALLTEWFSIRFHLNTEELSLLVSSVELLPVQERLERERRRSGVYHPGETGNYTLVEPPAKWIDWPFIDTSIQYSTSRDHGHMLEQGQYSSVVTGMVAGLDLDMAANGTVPSQPYSDSFRATLGKRDPRGGLLGPLDAREFYVGDVSSPSLPLVSNSLPGRGATVSTFPLYRLSDLQRVTLRGELPVGWEVELYRGADLIDFQTSSSDGRYEFLNVPTIPGLNDFRLVFYGPEGQRREENQPIFVAPASVGAGETGFRLFANQQNTDIFGNHPSNQPQGITPFNRFDLLTRNQLLSQQNINNGAFRAVAEVEHGVSDTVSLNGAVSSIPFGGTDRQYAQTGLRASILGVLTNIDASAAKDRGFALGGGAQSQIGNLSWLLAYNRFAHFISERSFDAILNEPLTSSSRLQLNGVTPDSVIGRMPFALSATYSEGENGASHTELLARLSSYIGRFTLGAETQSNLVTHEDPQTQEILRVGTQFGKIGLRGEAVYKLTPTAEFDAVRLTSDFLVRPNLNLRLGVTRFQTPPPETQFTAGAAVLFRYVALGADANISDRGDFSVLFKLSFGFGIDPHSETPVFHGEGFARSGAIAPLVFLDRDGDGKFGPGDVPLPNVRFRAEGARFPDETNEAGTAFITGLEPYHDTPVRIDVESLEDPYWKPAEQNIAVLPRPGSVLQLEFPVYETGEIDGVVLLDRGGQNIPLPGIRLQLLDKDGKAVAQTLSGYDGSFFVQGVRLGSFALRADPEQLAKLHLAPIEHESRGVEITRDNPAAAAGTIILRRMNTAEGQPGSAPDTASSGHLQP